MNRSVTKAGNDHLVILVGGNGVTPTIGLLDDLLEQSVFKDISMYWSLKQPQDTIYQNILEGLSQNHPEFSLSINYKRLNLDKIMTALPQAKQTTFIILESPVMVQATKKKIKKLGSLRNRQIITEGFAI